MNRYMLTNEGRVRFKRRKLSVEADMATMEGYEVLDYLYEHGAATLEEIVNNTGLSRNQVMEKIVSFMNRGLVEGLA